MINCPNCDKQIADDSAHCGYCGHQLEEKNDKKTMFGMAALGGDELKKAVEKAKKSKEGEDEGEKRDKFDIPKPGGAAQYKDGERKGLKIPKPGQTAKPQAGADQTNPEQAGPDQANPDQANPEQPSPDQANKNQADADEIGLAKTERIDLSDAQPPSAIEDDSESATEPHTPPSPQHEFRPEGSAHGLDSESSATIKASSLEDNSRNHDAHKTFEDGKNTSTGSDAYDRPPGQSVGEPSGPSLGEPAGPAPSQASQPGAQSGPFGPGAKSAEEANQEHQPGVPAQNQPSPPAGGPPAGPGGQPGPSPNAQQSDFGQQQVQASPPLDEQGGNNKMIIIGVTIATLVLGGACAVGLAVWAYSQFF